MVVQVVLSNRRYRSFSSVSLLVCVLVVIKKGNLDFWDIYNVSCIEIVKQLEILYIWGFYYILVYHEEDSRSAQLKHLFLGHSSSN